jgi:hypothetical protein
MPKGEALSSRPDHLSRALRTYASSFSFIADPKQLNHGIGKRKTLASRTLPGMLIRSSLVKAKLRKFFGLGSAWSGTDE